MTWRSHVGKQGYLAHKKTHPPRTLPYALGPMGVPGGWVCSYERGTPHPEGDSGETLKSLSHRCYRREVAFELELTKETIYLPLECHQGGVLLTKVDGRQAAIISFPLGPYRRPMPRVLWWS